MDVYRCFRLGSVALTLCLLHNPLTMAQTAPQAVTLKNGTRYVGQTANVSGFSSKQPNPWNSDQVALVYDGMRRIFFYRWHAGNLSPLGNDHMLANPTEFDIPQKTYNGTTRVTAELSFGPFNEFGHRIVRARNAEGTDTFVQGITKITPYFCEVKTLANPDNNRLRDWTMPIATSTIDPNVIRTLLEAQIKDRKNPADYLTIVDFFRESQKYQVALNELAFISDKFPDMKDVIEEQQTVIRQAQARQWIREVNRHIDVGQPKLASARLRAFARGGIAGEILAEMATIQTELKKSQQRVQDVSDSLTAMLDEVLADPAAANVQDDQIPMLKRFRSELVTELSTDNVNRLDAVARFLSDPQMSDLQKLSLAISGWFLGSNNATENFAVSQSFDTVRQLVIEYLSKADKARRAVILEELKKYEGGEPEYLARMIAQMAPQKRPDLTNVDPSTPLEYRFKIRGADANKDPLEFRYVVQLPPEYTPYRRYPCIVTLPTDRNLDRQMLMWCGTYNEKLGIKVGQATRNGYITIGVDWVRPGQSRYHYSAIEHKTVMTAVRKSLQQFSIDTDRVFLTGHGIGADAAYDIGISHPEHWAGVVGISGKVDKFPKFYREHIHLQLPVYSVVGEKDYASITPSETTWTRWLRSKQFVNCTVIEYVGRSNEFFVEEIVEIFKWAAGHRRRLPDRNALEIKMDIRRPWDNYFWFFELHGVPANKVVWPELYDTAYKKNGFPAPITMEAKLNKRPNQIRIEPTNQGDAATVWLSPEFVDLEKKIQITGRGDFNDFVSPSREILLEDVRLRGDRQHPFWANLHCGKKKKWFPNVMPERQTNR